MRAKNRGGTAAAIFAGGGLLGLLIVIAIMMSLSAESADTSLRAKQQADRQMDYIQDRLDVQGEQIDTMTEEMSGQAEGQGDWDLVLYAPGSDEQAVVEIVQRIRRTSEDKARALVKDIPAKVLVAVPKDRADKGKLQLMAAGAIVDVVNRNP